MLIKLSEGIILKSPLTVDNQHVKDYKIPKDVELHPRQKLAYLEEQLHQLKALHWRARVDMLHAKRLQEDSNPTLAEKGLSNMAQHRNEVQQTIGGIQMISQFIEELKRENPEIGQVTEADHPES